MHISTEGNQLLNNTLSFAQLSAYVLATIYSMKHQHRVLGLSYAINSAVIIVYIVCGLSLLY